MEWIKLAVDWAKNEVLAAKFFVLFAILFLMVTVGFWQLGKSQMAKAFVTPTLVTGLLLLIVGLGLWYANASRAKSFATLKQVDKVTFIKNEKARAAKTIKEYQTVVFTAIPIIIIVAALVLVFTQRYSWRAWAITVISFMAIIMAIDSTAHARMVKYQASLKQLTNP